MNVDDILAGPIIRRANEKMVTLWLATLEPYDLAPAVRVVGGDGKWIGIGSCTTVQACENLWVHLLVAVPVKGAFPTATLLEYSIAVVDPDGKEDHQPFAAIVRTDGLAYPGFPLPTFYLQKPGAKLNVLYASCRKPHDVNGDGSDALVHGDSLIFNNPDTLASRPTILCLTGDQIYADDVADETFDAMVALGKRLEGSTVESLPKGLSLPGKGARQKFVQREAFFTSTYARNHVITFAEFAAMYCIVWNPRVWPKGTAGDVGGFISTLHKVRRLLANTPTYMIFDDHDVTDDWNLSLQWFGEVHKTALGARIVANALFAFWLFQAWGNDPDRERPIINAVGKAAAARAQSTTLLEALFTAKNKANGWEFATPTYPAIYFIDTRTQRGHYDGFNQTQTKAPPYLKSIAGWAKTLTALQALVARQAAGTPLVIVATAPIFGYATIDRLQSAAGKFLGPYPYDEEGWAANLGHLELFLFLCGNADVVVLSGDVHYSFTATATFNVFDSDFFRSAQAQFPSWSFPATGSGSTPTYSHLYRGRFLQLNSSAAKNWASKLLEVVSRTGGSYGHVIRSTGAVEEGQYSGGKVRIPWSIPLVGSGTAEHDPASYKPVGALSVSVNNTAVNSPYEPQHNIGLMSITGRKIENGFLVGGKLVSSRTFDFASGSAWPS